MQPGPDPSKSRHHAGDDVKGLASRHEDRPTYPEKEASTQFAAKLLFFPSQLEPEAAGIPAENSSRDEGNVERRV